MSFFPASQLTTQQEIEARTTVPSVTSNGEKTAMTTMNYWVITEERTFTFSTSYYRVLDLDTSCFQSSWEISTKYFPYHRPLLTEVKVSRSVQRYADEAVIRKILEIENEYLDEILDRCFEKICVHLDKTGKRFQVGAYLSQDPEIPQWEGITILINTEYDNFEEKMYIWEKIEKEIEHIFRGFKERARTPKQIEQIEKVNQILATTLHRIRE